MDRGVKSELNEQQWDAAQQMLVQGKMAYDKLIKEAQRLLSSIGNNKSDHLYALLSNPQYIFSRKEVYLSFDLLVRCCNFFSQGKTFSCFWTTRKLNLSMWLCGRTDFLLLLCIRVLYIVLLSSMLCHLLQELPDGKPLTRAAFDQIMLDAGKSAETAHESLSGAKAQYNARKWSCFVQSVVLELKVRHSLQSRSCFESGSHEAMFCSSKRKHI